MKFTEFRAMCNEQGVSLHENLAELRSPKEKVNYNCYAPTSMFKAIVVAGRLLSDGHQILTNNVIELDDAMQDDTAAHALVNILNSSSSETDNGLSEILNFQRASFPGIWACRLAEPRFVKTYKDLERGVGKCQIVGDANGRPLFIRKTDIQPSAVSLAPVRVERTLYMPGSLFLLELLSDTPRSKIDINNYSGIQSFTADQVRGATFMRLTTLALGLDERNFTFSDTVIDWYFKNFRSHIDTVKSVTLGNIVDVTSKAYSPSINQEMSLAA